MAAQTWRIVICVGHPGGGNVSEVTFLAMATFAIGAHNFLACRRAKRIGKIIVSNQHQCRIDFSYNSLVLNRY